MTAESRLTQFRRYLARPVDAASLGAFRIWFGACVFIDALRYWDKVERYWIQTVVTFPLPGFSFLRPWPGDGMYVHYIVLAVAALAVMLGVAYRAAIVTLLLAHTYVFLLDESNYLNHFYLIALLAFLLCWMPADRWGALKFGGAGQRKPATVPFWTVFLLRSQLFLVYVFAGIAKLNPDWLRGFPIGYWIVDSASLPVIGPLFVHPLAGVGFAWGGLLYDLSVGFLLLFPRTRMFGLLWSAMFHLLNSQIFEIGIFPYLAMGATTIFAEPDWPRRVLHWVRRKLSSARLPDLAPARGPHRESPLLATGATALVVGYLAVQTLLPLRHWLIPGDVAWTEEGHILSWRMKLRNKEGELKAFVLENPRTGERTSHDPQQFLTHRQYGKMVTQPRMIQHYADWLADRYEREYGTRPRVHVDVWVSLNGREFQRLIDPRVDLAAVKPTLGASPWIVPLTTPLRPMATVLADRRARIREHEAEQEAADSTAVEPDL
jgi:hypothetical protein